MNYLIAYDLGTGGIKASIFNENGISLGDVFEQYDTYFFHEKYAEQRPSDWWRGVCSVTRRLLAESGISNKDIKGAALSGHSLVAVPIDLDGRLLAEYVPIWCDMRASAQAENFFKSVDYEAWYRTTGNGDPAETYTVMKLIWLRENHPEIFSKTEKILGSKDYINYLLTGRMYTDPSYASGFGVFNLKAWDYDENFIRAANLPRRIFPDIIPSDAIVGTVTSEAADLTGLAEGTIVACGAVDNTCMSLGATGLSEGHPYTSLGSSSWIAVTAREPVIDIKTRPFVFAHAGEGLFTSAVSIFSAGNSFRWVRDNLCRDLPADTDAYERMNQMAQSIPCGSNGVLFNPSLAGGSAQEFGPNLAGSFMGITLRTTREDLVRASMEGVAMALRQTLDILRSQTSISGPMLICGGGSKSMIWRQIFADVFQMPILKTNIDQNAASLGAAALAANACGIRNGYEWIPLCHRQEDLCLPITKNCKKYEKLMGIYTEWSAALAALGDRMADLT